MNWMLKIVIAKPMQFTIVKDEPLSSTAAFCAISVENKGESATITIPQISKNRRKETNEVLNKNKGEIRQQIPEIAKAAVAIFFAPKRFAIKPLATQATLPAKMMKNDSNGILISMLKCRL